MKLQLPAIYFDDAVIIDDNGMIRFNPKYTYIMFRGGRGRAGSWTMITVAVLMALQEPIDIMIVRQNKNKIKDSVWKLVSDTAERLGVLDKFKPTQTYIAVSNGSRFIYDHMHHNEQGIRSKEGIALTLGEECQQFEVEPINGLKPTITRQENSQFVGCMNPFMEDDAIERLICKDEDCLVVNATYLDNPFAPAKLVREAEKLKRNDIELYNHIYMGQYYSLSDEMVIKSKCVQENFRTPKDANFYHGGDWSNGGSHPHAFVRSFVRGNTLYIDWELKTNVDLNNDLWKMIDACPTLDRAARSGYSVYCDIANPANIRTMVNAGFDARRAQKVKGSLMGGVEYLKRFDRIVIHKRCVETWSEVNKWRWKKDARTGEIMPILIDGNDDIMAALRYAHYKQIKKGM